MGAAHRRCPGGHVELGEDALGVRAQRIERDVKLTGDLWSGELAVKKPRSTCSSRWLNGSASACCGSAAASTEVSALEESSGVRLHRGVGEPAACCSMASIGAPSGTAARGCSAPMCRPSFGEVQRAPVGGHRGHGEPGPEAVGSPARCRPAQPPPPRHAAGREDQAPSRLARHRLRRRCADQPVPRRAGAGHESGAHTHAGSPVRHPH